MKHILIILMAAALTLMSACTGGRKTNTAASGDEDIALSCYRLWCEQNNRDEGNLQPSDSPLSVEFTIPVDEETLFSGYVACYPMEDGAWLMILAQGGGDGEYSSEKYDTYIFKNGTLEEVNGILPVPPLGLLLDGECVKGKDVSKLRSAYKQRPYDYLFYGFYPDKKIVVPVLHSQNYIDDESAGIWNESVEECATPFEFLPVYKWNGKDFIQGPSVEFYPGF